MRRVHPALVLLALLCLLALPTLTRASLASAPKGKGSLLWKMNADHEAGPSRNGERLTALGQDDRGSALGGAGPLDLANETRPPAAAATATAALPPTRTPTATPQFDVWPRVVSAQTPTTLGMVAWWPAEGNADDIVNGNNGTLEDGATYAPGEVGQGFSFNGTGAYVAVPDSPSLDVQQLTVDAWVRFDSFYSGTCLSNEVVEKGNDHVAGRWGLSVFDPGSCGGPTGVHVAHLVMISSSNGAVGSVEGQTNLSLGTFYHLAATWDGTVGKVYVNGALDG